LVLELGTAINTIADHPVEDQGAFVLGSIGAVRGAPAGAEVGGEDLGALGIGTTLVQLAVTEAFDGEGVEAVDLAVGLLDEAVEERQPVAFETAGGFQANEPADRGRRL